MERIVLLVGFLISFVAVCKADFAAEFQERVKSLFDRFQEIDKRAGLLIAQSGSSDFKKYAEIRNEISRFIAEPRQEISRARSIGDENASQRIRAEQELKILLGDLEIDLTDEDDKPLPFSALVPRVDSALASTKGQLDEAQKALDEITAARLAKLQS